jgi:hypothetical protein
MTSFSHNDEEWRAIPTGGSTYQGQHTIGVLFTGVTSGREPFGRIHGLPYEQFGTATEEQLREALTAALAGDD